MKFVLLVTLFVSGQPPYSYQVPFDNETMCVAGMGRVEANYKYFQSTNPRTNLSFTTVCIANAQ